MTLDRKSAAGVAAAVVAGALFAPAIASADGHGHGNGHGKEPIPAWDAPIPEPHDSGHSPTLHLPESHKDDILDIPDHAKLPDLSKLPDFNDFHHHYKKEDKSKPVLVEKEYPPEPIQYPPQAPTDSLEPIEPTAGEIVPLALGAVVIMGAAGVAVRRTSAR